jgi:hypothetical protein
VRSSRCSSDLFFHSGTVRKKARQSACVEGALVGLVRRVRSLCCGLGQQPAEVKGPARPSLSHTTLPLVQPPPLRARHTCTCLYAPALLRTTRLHHSGQHSRSTRALLYVLSSSSLLAVMLVLASLSRSLNALPCRLSSPEISPPHSLLPGAHGAHAPSSPPHVGGARPSAAHIIHSLRTPLPRTPRLPNVPRTSTARWRSAANWCDNGDFAQKHMLSG